MRTINHISVSFHSFLFISISKTLNLFIEKRPGSLTSQRFIDVALFSILMSEFRTNGRNKSYLCKFLFIFFHFYLRNLTFVCSRKDCIDNRPVSQGCSAILLVRRLMAHKSYLCEFLSVSFHSLSQKHHIYG